MGGYVTCSFGVQTFEPQVWSLFLPEAEARFLLTPQIKPLYVLLSVVFYVQIKAPFPVLGPV